ncbi:hypothetical protein NMG60_11020159 [Bertholletia excelsa]
MNFFRPMRPGYYICRGGSGLAKEGNLLMLFNMVESLWFQTSVSVIYCNTQNPF